MIKKYSKNTNKENNEVKSIAKNEKSEKQSSPGKTIVKKYYNSNMSKRTEISIDKIHLTTKSKDSCILLSAEHIDILKSWIGTSCNLKLI